MKHIIGEIFLDTKPVVQVAYSTGKLYPPGTHFPGGSDPRPVPAVIETRLYRTEGDEFYAVQVASGGRSSLMKWNEKQVIIWLFLETLADNTSISPALLQWVRQRGIDGWIVECWERLVDKALFEPQT